jgi:hypothetical protein
MSVIGSNILAGASGQGGGYKLDRSLRFRSSASAYLSRTPASAGNRQIWTYSTWVKRGSLGSQQDVFISGSNVSSNLSFQNSFNSSDNFLIYASLSGVSNDIVLQTTQVFRDPSAWYHIIIAVDTTQATSSNRVKLYINGSQVTSFSTATYPTQNYSTSTNNTVAHTIGRFTNVSANYFDGYMAETHLVDGQALTPSSFGETSTTTGVWQPKRYAGTYGTNGFYLPFTDNSALTSGSNAGLGKDFSGNGNYWTTNNISITSGSTYDSMTDVPTLTSATASNFCTLNPLSANASFSIINALSNANLQTSSSTSNTVTLGTMGMATNSNSKYYCEFVLTVNGGGAPIIGLASAFAQTLSGTAPCVSYRTDGRVEKNGTTQTTTTTWTTNDVIGMAVDLTVNDGQVTFYKNNTSIYTLTGLITQFGSNDIFFGCQTNAASTTTFIANFGQRPFAYTPPTGFVALNTFNLPTPTIGATASTLANKNFDATLYTGTGANQSIVNSGGFQPDLVWVKGRSIALWPHLTDSVRGANRDLFSNSSSDEYYYSSGGSITAFNSNGFSLGTQSTEVNGNGYTFVGWQWKGGNGSVSNTAGSITSTVSANTSAGFSVVTYTGTGSNATIGHGLGVAPSMYIVKARNATGQDWLVYHKNANGTPQNGVMILNATSAFYANSIFWNNTAPTSSVFSVGTSDATNKSATTYVAYCFSEVSGYSKFGSYTGNGSSDGTFVYTGFRPRYVMFKRTDTTANWVVIDTARDTYNVAGKELFPNLSDAENDNRPEVDFLSNGFKLRWTYNGTNASGGNYIYAAFAENPYKYSLAR